jgi:predicted RND superfamily exporter protein
VRRSLFDESGQYNLLTVFPSAQAMEDSSKLLDFSQELDRIDQRISGLLPVSVMWMREIQGEAVKIAIILFILVFVMMLFSFRNIRYALIAMIPLAVGILLMFGLIALFRIQFSAFNLALTPAVIGIGIAYGSYLLQRYLVEDKRLDTTLSYTTKAIFLSAFTSMMGFGSLWIAANFAAIASVGALIFLGILSVLMVTLILLPALLAKGK